MAEISEAVSELRLLWLRLRLCFRLASVVVMEMKYLASLCARASARAHVIRLKAFLIITAL